MTHWLQACGIFSKIKYPYLNKEPFIPLPIQSNNESLKLIQMVTLWFLWTSGVTIGIFTFLIELWSGGKEKRKKSKTTKEACPMAKLSTGNELTIVAK